MVTAALGNTHWRDNFNVLAVHEDWVPVLLIGEATVPYTTSVERIALVTRNSSTTFLATFVLNDNFGSFSELLMVYIPDATETIQYDLASSYSQAAEAANTHTETAANETAGATAAQVLETDVSGVFTSVAAGDYCGIHVTSDTTLIRAMGLRVVWAN